MQVHNNVRKLGVAHCLASYYSYAGMAHDIIEIIYGGYTGSSYHLLAKCQRYTLDVRPGVNGVYLMRPAWSSKLRAAYWDGAQWRDPETFAPRYFSKIEQRAIYWYALDQGDAARLDVLPKAGK